MPAGSDVGHLWVYNTGDWGCKRMPGALAAPPRDCDFCDWVDITHEPVLFLAGGGGDGTASLLQAIPSQLQVNSLGGLQLSLVCAVHGAEAVRVHCLLHVSSARAMGA